MNTTSCFAVGTDRGLSASPAANETLSAAGFYISFNDVDHDTYGAATTALVIGQMRSFYILNGDHRAQYSALIHEGLAACLDYFIASAAEVNPFSEKDAIAARQRVGAG